MLAPLTAAYLVAAAQAYQIPQSYLYAILAVEGGRVGQAVADRNGTSDLGPFQINTRWGPAVARFWGMPLEAALSRVQTDGCANSIIAAAILKGCLSETRGDLSAAVGLYHSHTAELAQRYRERVLNSLASMKAVADH